MLQTAVAKVLFRLCACMYTVYIYNMRVTYLQLTVGSRVVVPLLTVRGRASFTHRNTIHARRDLGLILAWKSNLKVGVAFNSTPVRDDALPGGP